MNGDVLSGFVLWKNARFQPRRPSAPIVNDPLRSGADPENDRKQADDGQDDRLASSDGVTTVELTAANRTYRLKVCGPEGYFCRIMEVDFRTQANLEVSAPKDHSYFETVAGRVTGTDVVNKWIQIQVAGRPTDQLRTRSRFVASADSVEKGNIVFKTQDRVRAD